MGLFIGRRLGSEWGIGASFNDRDSSGCFTLFIILMVIGLIGRYLQVLLWLGGAALLLYMMSRIMTHRSKSQVDVGSVQALAVKLQRHLEVVRSAKTYPERQDNCAQGIEILDQIAALDPDNEVMANRLDLENYFNARAKTLRIEPKLKMVEKALFKRKEKQALDLLLDVLYDCKVNGVGDADFAVVKLVDGLTGESITMDFLLQRAGELGWKGERQDYETLKDPAAADNSVDGDRIWMFCPNCHQKHDVSDLIGAGGYDENADTPGQQVSCRKCGSEFTLPEVGRG